MQDSSARRPRQSCLIASTNALRIPRNHRERKHRRPQPGPPDIYWLGEFLDRPAADGGRFPLALLKNQTPD